MLINCIFAECVHFAFIENITILLQLALKLFAAAAAFTVAYSSCTAT